jgi:hypothetical protein
MRLKFLVTTIVYLAATTIAQGHGYLISELDSSGVPIALHVASQSNVLDSGNTASPYANLFWDKFPAAKGSDSLFTEGSLVSTPRSSPGAYYPTNDGGASTSGPFSVYDSATFTVISPLLFSNGGLAVPAASGVALNIVERFPGNAPNGASNSTNHPGAASTAAGLLTISGNTGLSSGFQFSLADTHEFAKDLFLGGSTATGEYGFAYTITVHYHNGTTLITAPMVDVFALTDTTLSGGSFTSASLAVQDAATLAIYQAAVPEPSAVILAATGVLLLVIRRLRRTTASV